MTRITRRRGIPMDGHEFRQRRLRLGLSAKDLAALFDMPPQSIYNFESVGRTHNRPMPQLVRLLQVAEEPGGVQLLERIAQRDPGAPPASEPDLVPEDREVAWVAGALVAAIQALTQETCPGLWEGLTPQQRGTWTRRLGWLVREVLRGKDGQAVLARRAVMNARRTARKNGKSPKKGLQSPET